MIVVNIWISSQIVKFENILWSWILLDRVRKKYILKTLFYIIRFEMIFVYYKKIKPVPKIPFWKSYLRNFQKLIPTKFQNK